MSSNNGYSALKRRMGARAAVAALSKIENAVDSFDGDTFWALDPAEAARIVIEGAGVKLGPHLEGYLAALGEFIHLCMEGGVPYTQEFRPLAVQTAEEVEATRAFWARDLLAGGG